jgi:enoyl-CoA hydratase/carnithine racemase
MNNSLETKQEGRVMRVWLNRPSQHNSLTTELCHELVHVLKGAEKNRTVGSILLAGKGESFCAGMDLNELARGEVESFGNVQETLFTIGSQLTKPLVGAVQGAAVASGTGVVANCHVVVAAENATFGLTGIRMGLWPFMFFNAIAAAVGERRALALAITGEIFNAAEALRIGLVHRVVPTEDVDRCALDIAQTVANYSSHALSSGLGFVHQVQGQSWKAAAGIGRIIRNEFLKSAEFQAELAAFLKQK